MSHLPTENSQLSEPSSADQSSMTDQLTQQPKASFIPLHSNESNCLLGFRSDAKAIELYDAATLRQNAVLDLLCALSGADLKPPASEPVNGCIQAIRLLCNDAAALYSAAWDGVQQEST
jgi:hypothetical protein